MATGWRIEPVRRQSFGGCETKEWQMRNIGLDLLRGAAIVLILLAHIGQSIDSPWGAPFGIPNFYHVTLGGLAVTIFLVLSGVVLQMQYGRKSINYPQFLAKRVLRIYPLYYLSMIFGFAIYCLRSRQELGTIAAGLAQLDITDLLLGATGTYAFAGKWGGPFVGTSWFIALIVSMYMIFPLLSRWIKTDPHRTIGALCVISLLSRLWLGQSDLLPMRPLDWFPLCRVFEFGLGMYLVRVVPVRQWTQFRWLEPIAPMISFISEISFPLFLIHYPFMFVIKLLIMKGVNQAVAIGGFLVLTIGLSWGLMLVDQKFPRKALLNRLSSWWQKLKFA
jgi:peptidoglycan/LPS O-acetylase OafA/YrhL